MFTYDRTTGPTASGTMVCCDGTDVRLAAADCGEGDNHYITMSDPNCAVAFEGPDNYGGPCAVVTCEGTTCVADPGVD
jgi:hypothetical protein